MSSTSKTAYEVDGYCLGRSFSSSSRLNLQHYLWKDVVGHNIHPNIPVHDNQDFSVADVGTGTGIWLIDLNRQLRTARLDGFDISADQYPPKEWLPANISLNVLDIHKPVPEDLREKYDVVNVRLFIAVVKNDNPLPIIENLMSMLKPGGYLQWSEHNLKTIKVETIKPGMKTDMIELLVDKARRVCTHGWPPLLPEYFKQQGLHDISYSRYPSSPELRTFWTQMQCMVSEEFSFIAMKNDDLKTGGPEYRRQIQEAAQETKKGAAMHFIPEVTVGRKLQ